MADSANIDYGAHPAPHRDRASLAELIFIIFAPPLAWSAHLVVNYAFASKSCYPDGGPRAAPIVRGLWPVLIAVDLASLLICALAALVAWRMWKTTSLEMSEIQPPMIETGEGRTRFLAIWGVLIGLGFFLAIIFDFVGLWILPICG